MLLVATAPGGAVAGVVGRVGQRSGETGDANPIARAPRRDSNRSTEDRANTATITGVASNHRKKPPFVIEVGVRKFPSAQHTLATTGRTLANVDRPAPESTITVRR